MSVVSFVNVTSWINGTGALSVSWPTGYAVDDLALLVVESRATQGSTVPSGWTELTTISPQDSGAAGLDETRLRLFWKRATSTSEAAVSVADTGNHTDAFMIVYTNVDPTGDPFDGLFGGVAAIGSSFSIPAITTTAHNVQVVDIITESGGSATSPWTTGWSNSNLTGLTTRADVHGGGLITAGIAITDGRMVSPGDTGATAVSRASGTSTVAYMKVGLRPTPEPPISGDAVSSFGWSTAASSTPIGQASSSFGWEDTGIGVETFTGTIASEFRWTSTAGGINARPITGTGASALGWQTAASGIVISPIIGAAASEFGWTEAAAGTRVNPHRAASSFGWETHIVAIRHYRGAAASSFGWETAGAGQVRITGRAASSWGWSTLVGAPNVDGYTFPDLGDQFGWETAAEGLEVPSGEAASRFGFSSEAHGRVPTTGHAASTFKWTDSAHGHIPLFGVAHSIFHSFSTAASGVDYSFYGPAASDWGMETEAAGVVVRPIIGVAESEFEWSVNGEGLLGSHVTMIVERLSLGPHGIWYQPPPPPTRPR